MALDLTGKTAFITGGARRIGRATALALANAGVNVVIHYKRSREEAEQLASEIQSIGPRAWVIQSDLGMNEEVETLIDRASGISGPLDILINNASMFPRSSFDSVTLEEVIHSVEVDAWAPFALGRRFAEKTQTGHIVNFLDTRIVINYDWSHVAYMAGKHLLGLFTRMMAVHLAPGIQVNAVAPGLILPPEGKGLDYLESLKGELPLKRIGSPEYVADAVLFLVRSEFITGQVIFVDGGRHLDEVGRG
ncbi:MAG: SDR family oxidoreductase [Armatimonadota bacterium]|nr:SDR family oxidoreductase [bacterium]